MDFAYPTIFSEDPRYYRLGSGPFRRRLFHAAEHLFVAHRPDGTPIFNYTQWVGTGSSVILSDVYHPGNDRGPGAVAVQIGSRFAVGIGFDILREFWPEIACKLKLPFRPMAGQEYPSPTGAVSCCCSANTALKFADVLRLLEDASSEATNSCNSPTWVRAAAQYPGRVVTFSPGMGTRNSIG